MNYKEFASDMPPEHSLEFTSAEESEEALLNLGFHQPVRQLGKGKFRYRISVRSTDAAELGSDRFSAAVSLHLEPPADMLMLLFPRSVSGSFLACGNQTGNDKLIILPGGSGTDIVVPDLAGSEAIMIPKARFIELTETICAMPKSFRPERLTVIEGNTAQLHALRREVVRHIANPESEDSREDLPNLVAAAIDWIGHSSGQWRPESLKGNATPMHLAKMVQAYLEEHYRESIRSEALCRLTGVSLRTVQRCFRQYFDQTITDYLKTIRLDATQRSLIAVHPSSTSVAEVALRHGFTHLGRFSVHYRERYGESPRQTLDSRADRKSYL